MENRWETGQIIPDDTVGAKQNILGIGLEWIRYGGREEGIKIKYVALGLDGSLCRSP